MGLNWKELDPQLQAKIMAEDPELARIYGGNEEEVHIPTEEEFQKEKEYWTNYYKSFGKQFGPPRFADILGDEADQAICELCEKVFDRDTGTECTDCGGFYCAEHYNMHICVFQ